MTETRTQDTEASGRGKAGTSLEVSRFIAAPRERVYAAWTDAESMRRWMCPGDVERAEVELDVREGGRYRIDMVKGDEVYEHTGEYRSVEPPERLSFTWISPATGGEPSVVTVRFLEREGGTEVVLRHERLPNEESAERHAGGWAAILEKLEAEVGEA